MVSISRFPWLADLYIIAGNLIDIPLYSMNTAINYHELQFFFTVCTFE